MTSPRLYYLSPEWDKRFTRDSLAWNALSASTAQIHDWTRALYETRPLAKGWSPPPVMVEKEKQSGDFIAAFRLTFAVSPSAWKSIQDLVGEAVEALPVNVTHSITQDDFDFLPIPKGKQPTYLLLHGLSGFRFQHGQDGYWDPARNQFDMSMGRTSGAPPAACKVPWLDPEEFAGKHLFLLARDWVASQEFVDRVKAKKLTGLNFHPIKYEVKASPARVQAKKVIPAPPKPDFASAAKGYSPKLGEQWKALWDWVIEAYQNRNWPARPPKLKPPLSANKVRDFEKKHGIQLPQDYVDTLTKFASEVTVDLGRVDRQDPAYQQRSEIDSRVQGLMFGGTMTLWSFSVPTQEYASFKQWAESMAEEEPDSKYHQHFLNKLPILQIRNGDFIALDLKSGVPTYLSHDGNDDLQGKPLGKNFADMITRWSWIGLPWPDFLPDSAFYDQRSKRLPESSPALQTWHAWLRGTPLPAGKA